MINIDNIYLDRELIRQFSHFQEDMMFRYNSDPITETLKAHQASDRRIAQLGSDRHETHLQRLLRVLRLRSRKRIVPKETLEVSCNIYPAGC